MANWSRLVGGWIGIACCLPVVGQVSAEPWPQWRGPRGDGTTHEAAIPRDWDGTSGRHIAWKTKLPGSGHASPIVWGDRIFTVSCDESTTERLLLCLDARSGRLLWRRTVIKAPLEQVHTRNGYASSTPATDGELVFVTFLEVGDRTVMATNVSKPRPIRMGKMVVAAYDFDGNRRWIVRPGDFASVHGYCTCPVIDGDRLILNGDHDGASYIVALDKKTGRTIWKTPRQFKTRSYSTPIIRTAGGRRELVLCGSKCVAGFDPQSGKRLWFVRGPTDQFVASTVFDGDRYYLAGGFPTFHVMSVRPGGNGDVSETHVAWHVEDARCYVPSPALCGGFLIVLDDRGTVGCYDTDTGKRLWKERIGRRFSASPIVAGTLVYLTDEQGTTTIIRPGPKLDVVGRSKLDERVYASPAVSSGRIYIRGVEHLYAIDGSVP